MKNLMKSKNNSVYVLFFEISSVVFTVYTACDVREDYAEGSSDAHIVKSAKQK